MKRVDEILLELSKRPELACLHLDAEHKINPPRTEIYVGMRGTKIVISDVVLDDNTTTTIVNALTQNIIEIENEGGAWKLNNNLSINRSNV